jgi:outer membrane protein TolC
VVQIHGESIPAWVLDPAVTFTQPLALHIPALWEWRIQKIQHEISERQYAEAVQAAFVRVCDRFFALCQARSGLESARRTAAVNDTIYQLNLGRFAVGKIAENDLLESELALLNANTAIENAVIDLGRAEAALKNLLGIHDSRRLSVIAEQEVPSDTIDEDRAIEQAAAHGLQELQLRARWLSDRSDVSAAFSAALPGALLETSAGVSYEAETLDGLAAANRSARAAVRLSVPLADWGRGVRKVKAARAGQRRSRIDSTLQQEQLGQSLRFMVRELALIRRQVSIAAKSDTVSLRRLDVAVNRYVIGKIDIREIRAAQQDRDNAQRAYISTL